MSEELEIEINKLKDEISMKNSIIITLKSELNKQITDKINALSELSYIKSSMTIKRPESTSVLKKG